jgi:hypothetical protein
MKINREKAMLALVNFVEQDILATMKSEAHKWVFGGLLPVLPRLVGAYVDRHSELLCSMGVIDNDGMFDTECAKSMLDAAFRVQPTLKVNVKDMLPESMAVLVKDFLSIEITFTGKDAEKLLQFAET